MTDERIGSEYYDQGEYFDADTAHITREDSPFRRYRLRKVLEIHLPEPADRVLDLGCGWGTFSFALAPLAGEVVGVDFSRRSVEICEARGEELGLENLRFLCRDGGDTGLGAETFDLVVAADLLEHLYPDDTARVFAEAFRVLRPGGRLSIWTPHRGHVLEILKNNGIILRPDPSHVDYKSLDRILEYAGNAGFEIERAYYAESHLPVLSSVERALLRWVPPLRRRIAVLARKPEPRSS